MLPPFVFLLQTPQIQGPLPPCSAPYGQEDLYDFRELRQFVVLNSILPESLVWAMICARYYLSIIQHISFEQLLLVLLDGGAPGEIKTGYALAFMEFT